MFFALHAYPTEWVGWWVFGYFRVHTYTRMTSLSRSGGASGNILGSSRCTKLHQGLCGLQLKAPPTQRRPFGL